MQEEINARINNKNSRIISTQTYNSPKQKHTNSVIDKENNITKFAGNKTKGTNEDINNIFNAFNGMNEQSKSLLLKKLGLSYNQLTSLGNEDKNVNTKFSAKKILKFSAFQSSRNQRPSTHKITGKSKSELKNGITVNQPAPAIQNNLDQDHGGEVFDDEIYDTENGNEDLNEMSNDIYDIMVRGNFNQGNKRDKSREDFPEEQSSWSSSEEALMKCEGLLAFQQLNGSKTCTANNSNSPSDIIYEENITESGFYYFIFANENEIRPNFMSVRFDLHKTVFDVSSATENCTNTMNCMLPLTFWSEDHVVLEVPENQPDNHLEISNANKTTSLDPCQEDNLIKGFSSYMDCHRLIVAESVCTPRKPIYMLFVLLVPILILCFAYI